MAQGWWEIQILCEPLLEEIVTWRLDKFGCRGSAREVQGISYLIKSYIPQSQVQILDLGALALWLKQDAIAVEQMPPRVTWQRIDEEDWSSSWKQHWKPEELGDRFLICPAWIEPPATDRLVLTLDPGVAFGTGAHPTTQLCLESLEMRLTELGDTPITLADVGCGSGILSIGAVLLGAQRVYAVDTDPLAVKATEENRDLNQISDQRITSELGSADRIKALADSGIQFDGIVCNILAEVIVDLVPTFSAIAHNKTWAILSGILTSQAKTVADILEQEGWIVATLWKRKEWCCFNIRRS